MLDTIKTWSKLDAIEKHEVIGSIYDLTETESKAYFSLLEGEITNVSQFSNAIGRDRTTAQRVLSKLVDEQLVHRRKINLANGGIKYAYEAVPFSSVKQNMVRQLETWYSLSRDKVLKL